MATEQTNIAHLLRCWNEGLDTYSLLAREEKFSAVGKEGELILKDAYSVFFRGVVVLSGFLAVIWGLILSVTIRTLLLSGLGI